MILDVAPLGVGNPLPEATIVLLDRLAGCEDIWHACHRVTFASLSSASAQVRSILIAREDHGDESVAQRQLDVTEAKLRVRIIDAIGQVRALVERAGLGSVMPFGGCFFDGNALAIHAARISRRVMD